MLLSSRVIGIPDSITMRLNEKALSLAEASALQPFGYTLFLWAIVIGYLAFGDLPDRWTLAGGGIILASGLYAWHRERVRARQAEIQPL